MNPTVTSTELSFQCTGNLCNVHCVWKNSVESTMHPLAVIMLFSFLATWVFGALIVPFALIGIYLKFYALAYVLIFYCAFSILFPPRPWEGMTKFLCLENTPYFRTQKYVFDEGASPPKPDTKSMHCCYPHGILTLGWSMMNTSSAFTNSETNIHWLVAPLLLYLPFTRDYM